MNEIFGCVFSGFLHFHRELLTTANNINTNLHNEKSEYYNLLFTSTYIISYVTFYKHLVVEVKIKL